MNTLQYDPKDVEKILGVNRHKLFYWMKTHRLLSPDIKGSGGMGSKRIFSFKNLLEITVIKELVDFGLDLSSIESMQKKNREEYENMVKLVVEKIESKSIIVEEFCFDLYRKGGQFVIGKVVEEGIEADMDDEGGYGSPYSIPSPRNILSEEEISKTTISIRVDIGRMGVNLAKALS
jgi:DNA-binding transcriptional MerR regulator